jgi:hypothetical protein
MNQPPQDPAEIDAILKQAFEPPAEGAATFSHEVDVTGLDLTDNSEEEALVRDDSRRDGVTVPELPDDDPKKQDSLFDTNPVAEVKDIVKEAFSKDYDFAQVQVDAVERDRFYRSGLHDEEMFYLVEAPGTGLTVKVAIPPSSQSEAAIAALDAWVRERHIGTNSVQYLHGFQLLNVWLMVREINGKPTDWYEKAAADAGGKITYSKLREMLSNPETVECIRDMNEVRWTAVTLALRIADYKHQLCLEALRSRKVFTTAGSA